MKPFIFEHWAIWNNDNPFHPRVMVSDESIKKLREFKTHDDAINWLFMDGHKDCARALNAHIKAAKQGSN